MFDSKPLIIGGIYAVNGARTMHKSDRKIQFPISKLF